MSLHEHHQLCCIKRSHIQKDFFLVEISLLALYLSNHAPFLLDQYLCSALGRGSHDLDRDMQKYKLSYPWNAQKMPKKQSVADRRMDRQMDRPTNTVTYIPQSPQQKWIDRHKNRWTDSVMSILFAILAWIFTDMKSSTCYHIEKQHNSKMPSHMAWKWKK